MGSSLSHEEELFVSFQWEDLLDYVVRSESEARNSTTAPSENRNEKGDQKFHLSFKEWQAWIGTMESEVDKNASSDAGGGAGASNVHFNMAASEACRRLTAEQLNEPLVVLAVHACCWWDQLRHSANDSGDAAAADAELEEKLGQLKDVMQRRVWHTPEDSGHDDEKQAGDDGEDEDVNWGSSSSSSDDDERHSPASAEAAPDVAVQEPRQQQRKRDKMWGAVKSVLRHADSARRGGRSPAAAADEGPLEASASCPREHYVADVLHLLLSLLQVRKAYAAHDAEAKKGDDIFRAQLRRLSAYCTVEQNALRQRSEENAHVDAALAMSARNLRQRPVLDLAFHLVLALCCALHPEADVAAHAGMSELQYIAAMMAEWSRSRRGEERGSRTRPRGAESENNSNGNNNDNNDNNRESKIWPLVKQIEQECIRRQYALETQTELLRCTHPKHGASLQQSIYELYQARKSCALRTSTPPPFSSPAVTAPAAGNANGEGEDREGSECAVKERIWQHERSQYIGQDHIWDTVSAHFLNADVFEQNKATVLVFFGPSGYGKSELARRIARAMYECRRIEHGDQTTAGESTGATPAGPTSPPSVDLEAEGKLVFIHMPSFCTRDSIYSLVDPPAAHVGDGILLSALLKENDAIVVLDEFEKCTADAIQHLWLSAFQKNGSLRSLKKKDRMVSTTHTTFILTCNLSAELIQSCAAEYMGADGRGTGSSDAACRRNQERLRASFTKDCRERCIRLFGEPLVNRMDYFFPFVPYTQKEKGDFVLMQLETILSYQREKKKKRIFVTARFVRAVTAQLKSFHASTVEAIVKPLVVKMNASKWTSVVLTVEERIQLGDGGVPPAGPDASEAQAATFVAIPAYAAEAGSSGGSVTSWDSLPCGKECLREWESEFRELYAPPPPLPPPSKAATAPAADLHDVAAQRATGGPLSPSAALGGGGGGVLVREAVTGELAKEYDLHKDVVLDHDLQKEVVHLKQLLLEKDKEIELLKHKVLLLERVVALLLCVVLSCLYVISFVIGVKLMLVLACLLALVLVFVLKMPLRLLWDAAKVLYSFLGPTKSAFLLAVLLAWVTAASRRMLYCA